MFTDDYIKYLKNEAKFQNIDIEILENNCIKLAEYSKVFKTPETLTKIASIIFQLTGYYVVSSGKKLAKIDGGFSNNEATKFTNLYIEYKGNKDLFLLYVNTESKKGTNFINEYVQQTVKKMVDLNQLFGEIITGAANVASSVWGAGSNNVQTGGYQPTTPNIPTGNTGIFPPQLYDILYGAGNAVGKGAGDGATSNSTTQIITYAGVGIGVIVILKMFKIF